MAWNDPNEVDWDVGDVLTADSLQSYVRDNLLALRALNFATQRHDLSSNISTLSTSFVDIDITNLKVELNISSDRLLCIASFMIDRVGSGGVPQGIGYYDLAVNQDASFSSFVRASNHADGLIKSNSFDLPVVLFGYWTNLAPGAKRITVQARTSTASYGSIIRNAQTVNLLALEV